MTLQRFDLNHLSAMTSGDVALALEVIAIFRSQADMWGRLLDPNLDCEQWADACHTIKGASIGIGALQLGKLCEDGELRGREGNVSLTEASVILNAIKDEIGQTIEAVSQAEYKLQQSESFTSATG